MVSRGNKSTVFLNRACVGENRRRSKAEMLRKVELKWLGVDIIPNFLSFIRIYLLGMAVNHPNYLRYLSRRLSNNFSDVFDRS